MTKRTKIKPPSLKKQKPAPAPSNQLSVPLDEWLKSVEKTKRWLIPGWLPAGGLALVSGTRKLTRKTYTSITLAASVAAGRQVLPFNPKEPAKVLFFLEEGAIAGVKDKWNAIEAANPGLAEGYKNIHFAFRKIIKLNVPSSRDLIMAEVNRLKPDLVLFDPLVYMIEGDENKTSDMRDCLATFQLIMATGATVVVAHHLNNDKGYKKRGVDIDQQVRGAGPLKDLYDVHIALRRYDENDPNVNVTIRNRDGATRHETVWWEFKPDDPTGELPTEFAKMHIGKWLPSPGEVKQKKLKGKRTKISVAIADSDQNKFSLLEVDKQYSFKDLSELWAVTSTDSKLIASSLANEGLLKISLNGIVTRENSESDMHNDLDSASDNA